MKKSNTLEHTFVICLFTSLVALIWFSFAYSSNATANEFMFNLKDCQTSIAGGLALLAALITVVTIRRQIQVSVDQHDEEKSRAEQTARAKLPANLLELSTYTDNIIRQFEPMSNSSSNSTIKFTVAFPSFPQRAFNDIADLIGRITVPVQNEKKRQLANSLQRLLVAITIHRFWLQDMEKIEFVNNDNCDQAIRTLHKTLELSVVIDKFFSYAYGKSELLEVRELDEASKSINFATRLHQAFHGTGNAWQSHFMIAELNKIRPSLWQATKRPTNVDPMLPD